MTFTFRILLRGEPASGVRVSFTTTAGTMEPPVLYTNSKGIATSVLRTTSQATVTLDTSVGHGGETTIYIRPVGIAIDPLEPRAGQEVAFSAISTIGPPHEYGWDFNGDGQLDSWAASPKYTYAAPGKFEARLRLVFSGGREELADRLVTVTR